MGWWFAIDLWKRVILALGLGIITGLALRSGLGAEDAGALATVWIKPWGDLFLNLIRMLIVPLIFTTLVAGVIALGDPKKLGSLGVFTIGLYFATTAIAVTIGLIMGTLFQPGRGLSAETFSGADTSSVEAKRSAAEAAGGLTERLIGIVPTNPIAAMANGDVLPIICLGSAF